MSILDDLSSKIDQGINSAGRMAEVAKLHNDLNQLDKQRQAFAARLGASLYEVTRNDDAIREGREQLYDGIEWVDREKASIEERLKHVEAAAAAEAAARGVLRCPRCGGDVGSEDKFCMGCGLPVSEVRAAYSAQMKTPLPDEQNGLVCSNCGAPVNEGDSFCMNCGTRIEKPERPVPPVPPEVASLASEPADSEPDPMTDKPVGSEEAPSAQADAAPSDPVQAEPAQVDADAETPEPEAQGDLTSGQEVTETEANDQDASEAASPSDDAGDEQPSSTWQAPEWDSEPQQPAEPVGVWGDAETTVLSDEEADEEQPVVARTPDPQPLVEEKWRPTSFDVEQAPPIPQLPEDEASWVLPPIPQLPEDQLESDDTAPGQGLAAGGQSQSAWASTDAFSDAPSTTVLDEKYVWDIGDGYPDLPSTTVLDESDALGYRDALTTVLTEAETTAVPHKGGERQEQEHRCPSCGWVYEPGMSFCGNCGTRLV